MFLDQREPSSTKIQYGHIGYRGFLGYENLHSVVGGTFYNRCISPHPPSKLEYRFEKPINFFDAWVGLADSSSPLVSANFLVRADGILVAVAENVSVASGAVHLEVPLFQAHVIELVIEAEQEIFCHALWLNPQVHYTPDITLRNPLGGVSIDLPVSQEIAEKCITVIISPGYESYVDNMLGSLYVNGNCKDATILLMAIDKNELMEDIARKYGAVIIGCSTGDKSRFTMKNATYMAPYIVYADYYIYLDGDMIILSELNPIFNNIASLSPKNIYACLEYGVPSNKTLGDLLISNEHPYYALPEDADFLKMTPIEKASKQVINGGVIAGSRRAMLGLETTMKAMMPQSAIWESVNPDVKWREQAIINIAAIRHGGLVILRPTLNVQLLHATDTAIHAEGKLFAVYGDAPVDILHFNGTPGKDRYIQVVNHFVNEANPKFGTLQKPSFELFKRNIHSYGAGHKRTDLNLSSEPFIDSLYKQLEIYQRLHEHTEQSQNVLSMSKDTLTIACMACAAGANSGNIKVLTNDDIKADLFMSMFPESVLKSLDTVDEDPLVYLKNLADSEDQKDKLDMIYLDTGNNDKHVSTAIMMGLKSLSKNGAIYVLDINYALCDFWFIVDKIKKRVPIKVEVIAQAENAKPNKLYMVRGTDG